MNPEQPKSSAVHERESVEKQLLKKGSPLKLIMKDSSFSQTFDSSIDVGYKSGELSSQSIDDRFKSKASGIIAESFKKEQVIRFDSGLGVEVCSPLPSESDICYPSEDETITKKKEKINTMKSESKSQFLWQDVYNLDQDGDTMLHLAIVDARSDVIFPLIRQAPHPDFLDVCNDLYQTPLHLATLTGKSNIVRRLVAAGATLDIQNFHGNTALHIAAKNGDLDCVQAILQPVEPEEIDDAQCRYVVYTEQNDLSHLINLKNYDGQTCIHLAAMGGFKKVLEFLYDRGADINDQEGKSGRTALHFAVENTNFELVQILVTKCHANIEAHNYARQSTIRVACTLCKANPLRSHAVIFEFLKRCLAERWESASDTGSSSTEEIQISDLHLGQRPSSGNSSNQK